MKKIIITLLFAGASLYSFGQTQFAIGIKGGPNFANINTDASAGENYNARTGFHLGAFALIKGERVGFQPEVLFSQQGSKLKYSGNPDIKTNFSYMNIPLILKLYTIAGINLQVGPQIGFLTSAKQELPTGTQDIKDDLKKTDISLALGVGWDLPFGLTIDGRYNWGLSDINSGAAPGSVKNQVWQFSVGYKLFRSGN
ncbi:porin family protein [Chryseolinea sp. H1M3-3]|uniref:porin family protein n=1 Tax=Chryseolinea sp. H1M3-3 TaxID=3034144 RepID=UPI0023EAB81B|nr:porin family protein [Chryseolinea sp. H1M3-3]